MVLRNIGTRRYLMAMASQFPVALEMTETMPVKYYIEELSSELLEKNLDPISQFFIGHFDKVLYFKKEIPVQIDEKWISLEIGQTMGLKDGGIFPGSSAQKTGGNLWQHSLLESFRHLLAVKNNPDRGDVFPDNKVHYFAKNAKAALDQIYQLKQKQWPLSQIKFHHCEHIEDGDYFIARTIVDGWTTWNRGPIDRFLY